LNKLEFEFPVVGGTPPPVKDLFETAVKHHRALGATLVAMGEEEAECHDPGEIAEFIVGLMLVMQANPVKSDPVYAYVRRTIEGKEFLTDLASRIIVLYNASNKDEEIKDVKDAISRVRLD
jgi:hypothetical protein